MGSKIKIEKLIVYSLVLFSLTSFINLNTRTIIEAKPVFEIYIAIFLLLALFKGRRRLDIHRFSLLLIIIFILLISLFKFFYTTHLAKFSDYLIIYKSFYYLSILLLASTFSKLSKDILIKIFDWLKYIFLFKYILVILNNGIFFVRPDVYVENNFELIFLLLLFIGKNIIFGKSNRKDVFIVLCIFIISGSRSGLFCLLIVLFLSDYGNGLKYRVAKYIVAVIVLFGFLYVSSQRMGSGDLSSIDRVQFLLLFYKELQSFDAINFFLGSPFLSPVSHSTASALSYYQELFSNHNNLVAFSVVFHSYLLRIFYDFGFLGLAFIMYVLFKLLSKIGLEKRFKLQIILIILATGLSVSSLNSVFVAFGLMLIIITDKESKPFYSNEKKLYDKKIKKQIS